METMNNRATQCESSLRLALRGSYPQSDALSATTCRLEISRFCPAARITTLKIHGAMSDNSKLAANNSGSGSQGLQRSISPAAPVPRRRPIPRKGHTKSRAGCLKCKSRKVKCDELTPRCGSCQRLRLVCEFPSPNPSGIETTPKPNEDVGALATTTLAKTLETKPGTFSMTDLRFFQHFLVSAHPPFPIGGRLVWLGVSQMTHEVGVALRCDICPHKLSTYCHVLSNMKFAHV